MDVLERISCSQVIGKDQMRFALTKIHAKPSEHVQEIRLSLPLVSGGMALRR
jgi:hypothetical protein